MRLRITLPDHYRHQLVLDRSISIHVHNTSALAGYAAVIATHCWSPKNALPTEHRSI